MEQEYKYINTRVISGVYATLYRHGTKYAVTNFSNESRTGLTIEFNTRTEANEYRENLRKGS